jgi:Isopropylmalate/homocitrate/citramalate synthases
MDCAVRVCEVGLRDGLQLVKEFFPTADKIAWLELEAAAGMPEIEVTSLVPAKVMPQFADAEDVIAAALALPNLDVTVLVPNLRGAERGIALGANTLDFVMSVSRSHSRANVRREPEESLADFERIVALCRELPAERRPRLKGGLSTALGCSYEGRVSVDDVRRYAAQLAEAGADELLVADTVGYADPAQVTTLFRALCEEVGALPLGAHFHDTRGLGLANVVAALECGVRSFDASLAGLGGCPFAPGATGNIVMEDLVFMLDSMGLRTGVDLAKLVAVREIPARHLAAGELHGAVARAGLPVNYVPAADRAPAPA